ncbi:hypothetical protein LV78_002080 [Actinosynnema pretiosum]|nr:hypothetical protein [Actinosynnema pretiosum]
MTGGDRAEWGGRAWVGCAGLGGFAGQLWACGGWVLWGRGWLDAVLRRQGWAGAGVGLGGCPGQGGEEFGASRSEGCGVGVDHDRARCQQCGRGGSPGSELPGQAWGVPPGVGHAQRVAVRRRDRGAPPRLRQAEAGGQLLSALHRQRWAFHHGQGLAGRGRRLREELAQVRRGHLGPGDHLGEHGAQRSGVRQDPRRVGGGPRQRGHREAVLELGARRVSGGHHPHPVGGWFAPAAQDEDLARRKERAHPVQVERVDAGELGARPGVAEGRAGPLGAGRRGRGEQEHSGEQALPRAAPLAAGQEFGRGQAEADQERGRGHPVREEEGQRVEVDRGGSGHGSTVGGGGGGWRGGRTGVVEKSEGCGELGGIAGFGRWGGVRARQKCGKAPGGLVAAGSLCTEGDHPSKSPSPDQNLASSSSWLIS